MSGSLRTRRWWRVAHLRRNPLVRGLDRLESGLLAVVLLFAILAIPLAITLGMNHYTELHATSQHQLADRHAVTATARADAPITGMGQLAAKHAVKVPATWDGGHGRVEVPAATTKGDHIRLWINGDGKVVQAPMSNNDAVVGAVCTGLLTWLGISAALWVSFLLARIGINRGRAARWHREWMLFNTNNHSGPRSG